MKYYSIKEQTLQDIADAIRNKTGLTENMSSEEMAGKIEGISGGGELQEKTVTPTTEVQEVTPDSGYYGLSKVVVNAAESVELPSAEEYTFGGIVTEETALISGGTYDRSPQTNRMYGLSFYVTNPIEITKIRFFSGGWGGVNTIKLIDESQKVLYSAEVTGVGSKAWFAHVPANPIRLGVGTKYYLFNTYFYYGGYNKAFSGTTFNNILSDVKGVYGTKTDAYPATVSNTEGGAFDFNFEVVAGETPDEYSVECVTMDNIAAEINRITNTTVPLTPAQMITALQSIPVQTS